MMSSTTARVAAFVAALAAVFALALGLGALAGPVAGEQGGHGSSAAHAGAGGSQGSGRAATGTPAAGGLAVTQDGWTLALAEQRVDPGAQTIRFTITDPDGEPVTSYTSQDGRDLDLVVVRRDLVGFQDLTPVLDPATGVWTATATFTPGVWRVLADADPEGAGDGPGRLVLGDDLLVPGTFAPVTLPSQDKPATTVAEYDVALSGTLAPGEASELTATVSLAGAPVTDLDAYLGAHGHLVALRGGDLASAEVEPTGSSTAGPDLAFTVDVPSAGDYRLFLDFSHLGVVHTAAFTLRAEGPGDE